MRFFVGILHKIRTEMKNPENFAFFLLKYFFSLQSSRMKKWQVVHMNR